MKESNIPPALAIAKPFIANIEKLCNKFQLDRVQISIAYIKNVFPDASLVLGSETSNQVKENVQAYSLATQDTMVKDIQRIFSKVPTKLLNPACWNI
jgi:aryl-alcohol dehydrogenase-like predicted oxidoreductase